MMLFRSARDSDLDAIHRLAEQSGVGMTTLPKDIKLLKKRLGWSCASYKKKLEQPINEYYLFVLENQRNHEIVGVSAIESKTGYDAPFYSYKVSQRTRMCHSSKIRSDYKVLSLVNDNQGCSELCTLFLCPKYRKNNNGLLLSKSRFLFMAAFPERFSPTVIADMRGVSDKHGNSPFWDNVGSHFFQMPFAEADRLTLTNHKQFIADLMPRNPIYVKLLAKEAQETIGKPHPLTEPAMHILLKEGFRYNNYVDIFDAGPTIEAPLKKIKTIESSQLVTIKNLSDEVSGPEHLLANTNMDFRSTLGAILINAKDGTGTLSKRTAQLLELQCGDIVRISPLHTPALA